MLGNNSNGFLGLSNMVQFMVGGTLVEAWTPGSILPQVEVNMSNRKIISLGVPTAPNDAARKADVDAISVPDLSDYLRRDGGQMTGDIYMVGTTGPQTDAAVHFGVRLARIQWSEPANSLVITKGQGNNPLTITDNDGTNSRPVIDQALGDARYLKVDGTNDMEQSLFMGEGYGLIWRNATAPSGFGALLYDDITAGAGFVIRRRSGTNVYVEDAQTSARNRILTDALDSRAATLVIEPGSFTTLPNAAWGQYWQGTYTALTRAGLSRILVVVSLNIQDIGGTTLAIGGVRISPGNFQRQVFIYKQGAATPACGATVSFILDVPANPLILVELATVDPLTPPANFITMAGAGNNLRSQITISDMGPIS
jgi:hypothetical protein